MDLLRKHWSMRLEYEQAFRHHHNKRPVRRPNCAGDRPEQIPAYIMDEMDALR